jgi:hypothetical protein
MRQVLLWKRLASLPGLLLLRNRVCRPCLFRNDQDQVIDLTEQMVYENGTLSQQQGKGIDNFGCCFDSLLIKIKIIRLDYTQC